MHGAFNFDIPIIQAPMAGGITTPELVAAVSNSGALGSLGAGYMFPDEIRLAIRKIKQLTNKPFNVNLFIPEKKPFSGDLADITKILSTIWSDLSDEPFEIPSFSTPSFDEQLQVILEEQVSIFSFTFGTIPNSATQLLKKQNIQIFGTATTPDEAQKLEQEGVDAIICQGQEAGGHRGNFSSSDPLYSLFPLLTLTKQKVRVPLVAAGGIMDKHSAKAAILAGAMAVQLGTAFITVSESGAHPVYKKALLEGIPEELSIFEFGRSETKKNRSDRGASLPSRGGCYKQSTMLTKIFTGKSARGVMNSFMEKLYDHPIPPYPIQHFLTKNIRSLAAQSNRPDLMSLWAGQGYPLCQSISAAELITQLF